MILLFRNVKSRGIIIIIVLTELMGKADTTPADGERILIHKRGV